MTRSPRPRRRWVGLLAVLASLQLGFYIPLCADGGGGGGGGGEPDPPGVDLHLDTSSVTLANGGSVLMYLGGNTPEPFRAYDLTLEFDGSILALGTTYPLAEFDDDGDFFREVLDAPGGTAQFVDLRHFDDSFSGEIFVAGLNFHAIAPGTTKIKISGSLVRADGTALPIASSQKTTIIVNP